MACQLPFFQMKDSDGRKSRWTGEDLPRFPGAEELLYEGGSRRSSLRKHHLDGERKNMETSKQNVGVGEEGAFQASSTKKALRTVGGRHSQWLEDAERQRKWQKRKGRTSSHIWKTATQRISHPTTCSMSDTPLVS